MRTARMLAPNLISRTPAVFQKLSLLLLVVAALLVIGLWWHDLHTDDTVRRDLTGLDPEQRDEYFKQPEFDFFKGMDRVNPDTNPDLDVDAIRGRNTWLLWTAGNDAFWDDIARESLGATDLLKILDSRHRHERFSRYGLMNDPTTLINHKKDDYGLYLDSERGDVSVPKQHKLNQKIYGRPSGVVGLRIFNNPDFHNDADAQARWETCKDHYYSDVDKCSRDPDLVRPYRVGMACAFCHVGPNPSNPPDDPEKPQWEHMSAYTGSQYFWTGRVFFAPRSWDEDVDQPGSPSRQNFVWQILSAMPPGTSDTSFIATDSIHNPRTMNAVYHMKARINNASERYNTEELSSENRLAIGTRDNQGKPKPLHVPRILKDGSDSIGVEAALSRVFINIGAYHIEWTSLFKPLLGYKAQKPFEIDKANQHSIYWQATTARMPNLAKYFVKASMPHKLKDVIHQAQLQRHKLKPEDSAQVQRGRMVFEEHCRSCHSSKGESVQASSPNFIDDNYLSTEKRVGLHHVKTNACSTLASNATRGAVWDNFSSETFKTLPRVANYLEFRHDDESVYGWLDSVDLLRFFGETSGVTSYLRLDRPEDDLIPPYRFSMPAGGRGYQRVPSLVSLWSSAPYLHNNSIGIYNHDPSVDGRMAAFHDGIEKLLWPEKRKDTEQHCRDRWNEPWCPPVYRTTDESNLIIERSVLENAGLWNLLIRRGTVGESDRALKLGPIPKGTPVNLLASLNYRIKADLNFQAVAIADLFTQLKAQFRKIEEASATAKKRGSELNVDERNNFLKPVIPSLLDSSNCPDFVVDRGHYFGIYGDKPMTDQDKYNLIEFLKHL